KFEISTTKSEKSIRGFCSHLGCEARQSLAKTWEQEKQPKVHSRYSKYLPKFSQGTLKIY
ncbi:hypothetical protein COC54_30180, partial [Bacillus pseudomycoides]